MKVNAARTQRAESPELFIQKESSQNLTTLRGRGRQLVGEEIVAHRFSLCAI